MKVLHISDLEDRLSLINGDFPILLELQNGDRVPLTLEYLAADGIYVERTPLGHRTLIIKVPKESTNEPR